MPSSKILVIGSGPSGLVAALTLAQNGVPVRIIEKSTTNRIGQRGAGIMPRTLEIFETLGFVDQVMKRSIQLPRVAWYKTPGEKEVVEFDLSPSVPSTPSCPHMTARALGQDNLDKILRAEMDKYGVTVELGVELTTLENTGDHVKVTLQKANGEAEEASYNYVIGADGAKSTVRKQLGLAFTGETTEINMFIGDLKLEGVTGDRWLLFGTTNDILSIRPTEVPGLFNFLVGGGNNETPSDAALKDLLNERTGGRGEIKVKEIVCISPYTVNIRMVDSLHSGRAFLVGDAAHIHPPTGSQGMNTGIQDSYNIAWKLALVEKGLAHRSLLSTFSEERIPVISEMLDITAGYMEKTFRKKDLRPGDIEHMSATNMLGVNYRSSSIVFDESISKEATRTSAYGGTDGPVCAGDRAPDAPGLLKFGDKGETAIRLHKLLSPTYHTVLIFADKVADILQSGHSCCLMYQRDLVRSVVIRSSGIPLTQEDVKGDVYEDRDGHAYAAYTGPEGISNVFIIRPDGYIGARLGSLGSVEGYFRSIFSDYAQMV